MHRLQCPMGASPLPSQQGAAHSLCQLSLGWKQPMPLPAPAALLTGGRCRPQHPWGSSSLPPYQEGRRGMQGVCACWLPSCSCMAVVSDSRWAAAQIQLAAAPVCQGLLLATPWARRGPTAAASLCAPAFNAAGSAPRAALPDPSLARSGRWPGPLTAGQQARRVRRGGAPPARRQAGGRPTAASAHSVLGRKHIAGEVLLSRGQLLQVFRQ